MAVLVAFGGLPGVGKTTVARAVARRTGAMLLRIDDIETAITHDHPDRVDLGPEGYHIAAAVADGNLRLGHTVLADSVNGVSYTRALWQRTAKAAGVPLVQVWLVCTDPETHEARVTARRRADPSLDLPDWPAVCARAFEDWPDADLRLDTSRMSPADAAERVAALIPARAAIPER